MQEQKTLVLIKPDAMKKRIIGKVLDMIHNENVHIIGAKILKVPIELAQEHYKEHKDKPFFQSLIDYITGKYHNEPIFALVLKGENIIPKIRKIAGATNPKNAEPDTIRGKFGEVNEKIDLIENVIHASDSEESAEREIKLWFKDNEIIE